jgi:hypothetical protein
MERKKLRRRLLILYLYSIQSYTNNTFINCIHVHIKVLLTHATEFMMLFNQRLNKTNVWPYIYYAAIP